MTTGQTRDITELATQYRSLVQRVHAAAKRIDSRLNSGGCSGAARDIIVTQRKLKFAAKLLKWAKVPPGAASSALIKSLIQQLDEVEAELSRALANLDNNK